MVLPAESSCRAWATAQSTASTTGRQSLLNRRASEHTRGGGSNLRGRHSGFVRSLARSTTSFASGDISGKLAELLRLGRVHEVYYPDEARRAVFKQLMQHYDDVVAQPVRLKLNMKARLRTHGVIVRGKAVYGRCGRIAGLAQVESPAARQAIEQLYALLDATIATQREALTLLRRHARQYPEIGRFQAVPGVGLIGAARFSAYI